MAGITSYGAYIPRYRLGKETAGWGLPVEKPVGNFDEDSLTMAVAAGNDCIEGLDRSAVDGLFFATTTSPYIEKQGASIVAAAVDLGRNILTNDITNSLRAGTLAMRSALDAIAAGSAKQIMVTVADCRMGAPGSEVEQVSGDGAGALLFGANGVIAEVVGSYSVSDEMIDMWRAEGDMNVRTWEDRFVLETGYFKILPEAVSGLMQKLNLTPKDITKACYYGPNPRRHGEMARRLGLDPETQVQDPLFGRMGNTGAAHSIMLLIAALEEAKPGDKILVASYGDGADAYLLEVTGEIEKFGPRHGIKGNLEAKRIRKAVGVRGAAMRGLDGGPPSISARWREREEIDRLHGAKCLSCGLIQYPPQRVCSKCHAKDQWETVRLADKKGKIFTFSLDYLVPGIDQPLAITIINFEGGGRGLFMMTDREIEDVACESPVEMSFRKLRSSGGVHNYYWKAIPQRF
jgi:hydroxymethylglutaryl-CoA synthase